MDSNTQVLPHAVLESRFSAEVPTLGDLARVVERLMAKKFPPDQPVTGYVDAASGRLSVMVIIKENV